MRLRRLRRLRRAFPLALLLAWLGALPAPAAGGLLPDLQTVVPRHLGVQNSHQREILRFANGIANTGAGDWRMRPEFPGADPAQPQTAVQEILDSSGAVVAEHTVSSFEFHPAHNHWHIAGVALFEVRVALDGGMGGSWGGVFVNDAGVAQSLKVTFCLIDWYALEGNSPTKSRRYFECNAGYQGISPGWVDQYNQAVPGQEIDITGAPPGVYYLVSTANPDASFVEASTSNNTAWVSLRLSRDSRGNPKIALVSHSSCAGAMCGDKAPNR